MEKKFSNGLQYALPAPNAPEFIKARLYFKTEDFKKFLEENTNERGYVNVDILESKAGGKYYGVLNEWKKPEGLESTQDHAAPPLDYPEEEIRAEDVPF